MSKKPGTVQMLVNSVLYEVMLAQKPIRHLNERLAALEDDIEPRDYRSAMESLKRANDAIATIEQIARRIEVKR